MHENDPNTRSDSPAERPSDGTRADEGAHLPQHLALLPGGQWAIWRWVGLRSAGFPVQQVFELSSPHCAAIADQYVAAQDLAQQAQAELLNALPPAQTQSDPNRRTALRKAVRQIKQGQMPELPAIEQAQEAMDAYQAACTRLQEAESDFHRTLEAAITQITRAIYATACDNRFREALLWQNRHALRTGVDVLLRKSPDAAARSSQRRQHESLIVSYLQRYCTKNDTIGFFGPVGWARVADQGAAASVQAGPTLLAARTVYFEGWCMDLLADTLAKDEALHPWFAPRRMPQVDVDGTTLHLPLAPPVKLSTAQAAVFHACDGERTAKEIAAELVRDPANGLKSEAQVYEILKEMRSRRRIAWTLEVPAEGLYPEQSLRQRIERIGDELPRQAALSALDELEAARSAVADAAGDVERLDLALQGLDAAFTRLTAAASTRRAGKTYAGRTLVYEDCQRDIQVSLGPEFFAALGPPLTLLLTSARWFTFQAAETYRKAFKEIYAELARKTGARTVDFASFWLWGHSLIFGEDLRLIHPLVSMLQENWAAILSIPAGQRRVEYAGRDLQQRVLEAFAAPRPGWTSARYHSPDVMIAASSLQAIQAGQYQCVMGELHPGVNSLKFALFVGQHPAPGELLRARESDLPEPRIVLVTSREWGGPTLRMSNVLVSPEDWRLVFAHDSCGVPSSQALPIGALVMEEADDTLMVRTRDGRLRFDIIEILNELLMMQVVHHFDLVTPSRHTARISFDRLVVCRETWQFAPQELPFAWDKGEAECFVNARRWMRIHGIPRFVFVRTPTEKKPFYVDFASPISINFFAKAVRQTAEGDSAGALIKITEMLPDPEQTWLTDHEGQRYTCEFRMVAVDMQ